VSQAGQKVLEDAKLKLASVASNTQCKSGRAILAGIIGGEQSCEPSRTSLWDTCAPRSRNYRQLYKARCVTIIAFFGGACFANCTLSKLKLSC
jgi:hypothetical protein